jgi:hypothetical protein
MKMIMLLIMVLSLNLIFAPISRADVPAPPVNQQIGIPDSSIADLTEADCRFCHEDPNIVDDANIPNRHHLLVGTPVADLTVRPFPDGDTNGNYDCFSCHELVWDPLSMSYQFETFRDCLLCHNTGSPHHTTAQAQAQNCDVCHGPVDNPFDGHFIPDAPVSYVTPSRSGGDGLPFNSRGKGAGACDYCHDSGLTTEGIIADTNQNLHHNTSLFSQSPPVCDWCHDFGLPFEEQIRVCERCHGISSLHNIQVDSDATGLVDTTGDGIGDTDNIGNIIPNMENPFWGHIGNNDDCWGCHGFMSMSGTEIGPIIPDISGLSAYSMPAGSDTDIIVIGSTFINIVMTQEGPFALESEVVLTAADGTRTTLSPDAITESSIDVTIPGTLPAGNYILRAVKDSRDSNAVNIAITPPVAIADATCQKKRGLLTINGSGFGIRPEGSGTDINLLVNGQTVDIISWTENRIKASISNCPKDSIITVKALFGAASTASGKPPKPCRGKGCNKIH